MHKNIKHKIIDDYKNNRKLETTLNMEIHNIYLVLYKVCLPLLPSVL